MTLLTLNSGREHDPAAVAAFIAQTSRAQPSALEDLNLAFFEDGVVLESRRRRDARSADLHRAPVERRAPRSVMSHPRVVVRAGRNSRCDADRALRRRRRRRMLHERRDCDIEVAAGAQRRALPHAAGVDARASTSGTSTSRSQQDSRYVVARHRAGREPRARRISRRMLRGPRRARRTRRLFAPLGTQHLDAHTRDRSRRCRTRPAKRTIAASPAGAAAACSTARSSCGPDAQKTDARQSSRNLLLVAGAEIDTKPELEIYANDVKCSHGATTGQLDADRPLLPALARPRRSRRRARC